MATHSSILAWRIPRTEDPGQLQSTGSQRVPTDTRTKGWHENEAPIYLYIDIFELIGELFKKVCI